MDKAYIIEWLTIIILSGTILGKLCNMWIVKPLTTSINSLKEMLAQAQEMLKRLETEQHGLEKEQSDLDKRLTLVEKETERAHGRIDKVKGVICK